MASWAAKLSVHGVAGTWKDLTDNVNFMAANLTTQVRGIAKVVTAVANGDLKRKLILETKGEIAELADTINGMIDTLATFADQVTTVAREVGIEGKLGGQARVPGAAGIWRDLTDNVNQLAANLTTQVRAIAEVATAVTKGDLTRSIAVQAQGEVAALKDNINEMILNLAATTRKNNEQDWLKTNIAKFTGMMQGQRDLLTVAQLLLSELTPLIGAQHGTFYIADQIEESPVLKLLAGYAIDADNVPRYFKIGQGLVGQCARERQRILTSNVTGDYLRINSSLGSAAPVSIICLPVLFEGDVKAAIEFAGFFQFSDVHLAFLDQVTQSIGIVLNTIAATMRTEQLLQQSQALAEELQSQQLQLQQTNAELQEKAQLLAEQKAEVEVKNQEVEQAKKALEEKAEQLSVTSKYKSEFLANMSHELRTPLNNLLILARMLSENSDKNLTPKQVKFAETIHTSGTDLLSLISDILDLSKIESGKMDVEVGGVRFTELQDYCSKTFRHVAEGKGIDFNIELGSSLYSEIMHTDAKRLQQVLKNLLSNALKFTEHGSVQLTIEKATSGWTPGHMILSRAKAVIGFSVADTGIGIQTDKQKIIFEAFQQADGTTSRKYGGTGLGLSISRELARLLGGEIRLQSAPGVGSTFTFYLPQTYVAAAQLPKSEALKTTPVLLEQSSAPAAEVDVILPSSPLSDQELVEDLVIDDDRNIVQPGDSALLIVEDDVTFARILVDLAHDRGLKALVALRGSSAMALAREFKPGAITLDINLPDMAGWTILDRLKHDSATRHIPVHVITGDENRRRGLALGAMTYLEKAVAKDSLEEAFTTIEHSTKKRVKKMLVVCASEVERLAIVECLNAPDVDLIDVSTGGEGLAVLKGQYVDGVVVHLDLHDIGPLPLVEMIQAHSRPYVPPVVVFNPRPLTEAEELDLVGLARTSLVKTAPTLEQLLDASVLLLHRAEADLTPEQCRILEQLRQADPTLFGKKVLVVDDDVRNIFALTSLLEDHNLNVLHAENGRRGIEMLRTTPDIDVVLMDIMMPEMDGYETMKAIREVPEFRSLPIIALTAKAMKGGSRKMHRSGRLRLHH
jgi:signal transduction histidine kinase/DNA-binding response OmpR family regulator/HAMP domain-containing protein